MSTAKFSNLYLLSQRERRALKVPFRNPATVILAENGMGKSAVAKSLYEVFGGVPHQIDQPWRGAGVSSALEFSVGGKEFTVVHSGSIYAIYDGRGEPIIRTERLEEFFAPRLADIFNFKLVMTDSGRNPVVPPPSYIFAPFYIDQDGGWSRAWKSFENMNLPGSAKSLAEYHSGIRPNEYYEALAERERLNFQRRQLVRERRALDQTYLKFKETIGESAVNYNLDDFVLEVEELVSESDKLRLEQEGYSIAISDLHSERSGWVNHQALLSVALKEMRSSFELAASIPTDVECPTCGAHYENSMAERFGIIENEDGIIHAMLHASGRMAEIDSEIELLRSKLEAAEVRVSAIRHILSKKRGGITFRDVVVAESRGETARVFSARLGALADRIDTISRFVDEQSEAMRRASSPKRTHEIRRFFAERLVEFGKELDLRPHEVDGLTMIEGVGGRGSARPRAYLTYFYAFLHTVREFSSAEFCPIVIDAPNQQGPDDAHMESILRFIIDRRPLGAQVIVATEKLHGITARDAGIVSVENKKHGVLREDMYSEVSHFMRPYLGNLI